MNAEKLTKKNLRTVKRLEPRKVFEYFARLSSVPHGSGNTGEISRLCAEMGRELGLETVSDRLGNVIIKKPGGAGRENEPPVILQAHLDMVCAVGPGCKKDMSAEGVEFVLRGGELSARGTSLGGDDCIGAAIMLALLSDGELSAPPLEAVFTVDEETGMYGADALDCSLLSGRRMINIDSEEEGVLTAGCAGGVRVTLSLPPLETAAPADGEKTFEITLSGLKGGHSGVEINLGRGNASTALSRALSRCLPEGAGLVSWSGGRFDNVIMAECRAAVTAKDAGFEERLRGEVKKELSSCPAEDGAKLEIKTVPAAPALSAADTARIVGLLASLPQGVRKMSPDMEGLVQTSLNVGRACVSPGGAGISLSVRSSVREEKEELVRELGSIASDHGFSMSCAGDYPGWKFEPVSPLRDAFEKTYLDLYCWKPETVAIHAGLECGFFADRIPGLDCVSVGPDIKDIHTFRETLSVSSTDRLYRLIREVLSEI
ncbi:MAG: beta-Ala-His dipeptidase [Clostridia bacterium]|nr:beta-Ala-His dipeptidase [Clostridia bacterium]